MIRILAQGKARQPFVQEGIAEYLQRLGKYTKVEYQELEMFSSSTGGTEFIIVLDEHGKEMTSEEFAAFINKKIMEHKIITFLIGEAAGVPVSVKQNANATISLSKMTFPTQLVRVIFLEQLYRTFTILKNEPYHK